MNKIEYSIRYLELLIDRKYSMLIVDNKYSKLNIRIDV